MNLESQTRVRTISWFNFRFLSTSRGRINAAEISTNQTKIPSFLEICDRNQWNIKYNTLWSNISVKGGSIDTRTDNTERVKTVSRQLIRTIWSYHHHSSGAGAKYKKIIKHTPRAEITCLLCCHGGKKMNCIFCVPLGRLGCFVSIDWLQYWLDFLLVTPVRAQRRFFSFLLFHFPAAFDPHRSWSYCVTRQLRDLMSAVKMNANRSK